MDRVVHQLNIQNYNQELIPLYGDWLRPTNITSQTNISSLAPLNPRLPANPSFADLHLTQSLVCFLQVSDSMIFKYRAFKYLIIFMLQAGVVEMDKEELISTSESNPSSFESSREFFELDPEASLLPEPAFLLSQSSTNKLLSYFMWFKQNGIQEGDPRTIEQEHFRNKKEKVLEIIRKQSILESSDGQVRERATTMKRKFSKNLVIDTKL